MNLRQMTAWGQSRPDGEKGPELPVAERFLTLLAEGAALGVPEVDSELYKEFRGQVAQLALQLPDRLSDDEKLAQIRAVLSRFENYRNRSEAEIRNRTTEWHGLATFLFTELLKSLAIDPAAANPEGLLRRIAGVTSAANIEDYRQQMELFLHPSGADSAPAEASQFRKADHTTANDNAAGLRGGGSAIEHLRGVMERGDKGFIVLFRLLFLFDLKNIDHAGPVIDLHELKGHAEREGGGTENAAAPLRLEPLPNKSEQVVVSKNQNNGKQRRRYSCAGKKNGEIGTHGTPSTARRGTHAVRPRSRAKYIPGAGSYAGFRRVEREADAGRMRQEKGQREWG